MAAIRTARSAEGRFVMIANGAAQDRRLTAAARGIILFALSLPPNSHFTAGWLEKQLPDGRRAIRSALRNLEECGYYRRTRTAVGKGTWHWEQVISDAPVFSQVATSDGNRSDELTCDDAPDTEFPQVATSDRIASDENRSDKELKTDGSKTNDLKKGNEPASTTGELAPPPAASQKVKIHNGAAARGLPVSGDWRDDLDPLVPPHRG